MITLRNPAITVWAVLVLATCASTWWLAKDAVAPAIGTAAIVVIAAIKIRFVIGHFMEVRTAPLQLRVITDVWLLAVTGMILGVYFL